MVLCLVESNSGSSGRAAASAFCGKLNVAEAFETFLQTKYVGQKRFSLEGGEALIPLLDVVISEAADAGLDESRGRHGAPRQAQRAGQRHRQVLRADLQGVRGQPRPEVHPGLRRREVPPGRVTARSPRRPASSIPASLVANPSHLECVDPVTEGVVRAKQDILDKSQDGFTVLPVLIHGDAAFAGQGVVAETLNLSQLRGYRTGGTVHIVVNNQVGFTTSPMESRSSVYATDVARMIQAPIFHVNGDDPEAVARVGRLSFAYRETFRKDVVIDMVCYRRRGHNEGDNPSFTQPLMYDLIEARRSVRKLYTESLIARGDLTMEEAEAALRDYQQQLERAFTETREAAELPAQPGTVLPRRGRRPPGRPRRPCPPRSRWTR